jgi:ankyrin repeat protein
MSKSLVDAIRRGDVSGVRQLLSQGADPNWRLAAESDHGLFFADVTALMVAVATPKSNVEIVKLLLENGGDLFALSAVEVTPTWYASGGGTDFPRGQAERDALEPGHPDYGWGGGDVEILKLLLDSGGDPNESAPNGRTCVYEASAIGDPQRLALLIERGANVEPIFPASSHPDSLGSPFSNIFGHDVEPGYLKYLSSSRHQGVPLFAAAGSGNLDCVKLIVEAGFPADFELNGTNALTEAQGLEVVEYLYLNGVSLGQNDFGFDILDRAIDDNDLSVIRFLAERADRTTIQRKLIVASGVRMNPDAVRVLLELGADANESSPGYGSPLHYACWQGDGDNGRPTEVVAETINVLIDAGADPNLLANGSRPLHEAAFGDWGSPTAVRILLSRGAEVDATDDDGRTPLMLAAEWGEVECVRLLLAAGADRTLKDHAEKTALDYAKVRLGVWSKPRSESFNEGQSKATEMLGYNGEDLGMLALAEAQEIVALLQS